MEDILGFTEKGKEGQAAYVPPASLMLPDYSHDALPNYDECWHNAINYITISPVFPLICSRI